MHVTIARCRDGGRGSSTGDRSPEYRRFLLRTSSISDMEPPWTSPLLVRIPPLSGCPPYVSGERRVQNENGVHDSGRRGAKHSGHGDAYPAPLRINLDDWNALGPKGTGEGFSHPERGGQLGH